MHRVKSLPLKKKYYVFMIPYIIFIIIFIVIIVIIVVLLIEGEDDEEELGDFLGKIKCIFEVFRLNEYANNKSRIFIIK